MRINASKQQSQAETPQPATQAESVRLGQPFGLAGSLLQLQQMHGNGFVQRLLRTGAIQAKVAISEPGDRYEQEADRVAEQVMRMPDSDADDSLQVAGQAVGLSIQRVCQECEEELQRQPDGRGKRKESQPSDQGSSRSAEAGPQVEAPIQAVRGDGQPLTESVRAFFEPRFGYDFSQVRVHSGGAAGQSARDVNAHAYTVGHNIVFGAGWFAPGTHEGRRLIAHELTHVVQQSGEQIQAMLQRKEENNADLAAIHGLPMYELLTRLSELPENILDDEEAGGFVGGPRLVIAMRVVKSKMRKEYDFLTNNRRALKALPYDQFAYILTFLAVPDERKSRKTINTDLEVDITIVAPSNIRLRGEQKGEGMIYLGDLSSPDAIAISDFEEGLLKDRSIITGVVLDPDTQEIIGYRSPAATGLTRLVDREGNIAWETEIGLETPIVDPIDFVPNPAGLAKGVAKAGAGIAGKIVLKGALKKGAVSGGKVTLGAIVKMRSVDRAIAKKALSPSSEAKAFIKSVTSGVKVSRTLSTQAAEELVKGKLGRFMAEDLNKLGTIGPFESFQIITRGHAGAYQAHHIVETAVLKHLGHDVGRAPSVILRAAEHIPISKLLAEKISKGELEHLTKKQLLKEYEMAYKNHPAWIAEVRRYFK